MLTTIGRDAQTVRSADKAERGALAARSKRKAGGERKT